jgi:glycosyltransferase involved in cell wall biosynthesis
MADYKGLLVNFVSSWTPRVCGVGSFTQDTTAAIATYEDSVKQIKIHPIDKTGLRYTNPPIRKKHVIRQLDTSSWKEVGNMIVERSHRRKLEDGFQSIVVLEHEYGLDGNGQDNNFNYIAQILKQGKVPTIAVLHTVKKEANEHEKRVLQQLSRNCNQLVVLSPSGIDTLKDFYGIKNVTYISHGVPEIDRSISKRDRKAKFGLEDKFVIGTHGLVSKGKGLGYGIEAYEKFLGMVEPSFRKNIVYLIGGQTHPEVLARNNGKDSHREELWKLCERKNLNPFETKSENINEDKRIEDFNDHRVIFINTHLGDNTLLNLISAEDVGLTPYTDPQQISSGIIFYHAGIGTPCVSSDNVCAKDLYRNRKGEHFYIKKILEKDEKFREEVSGVLTEIGNTDQIAQGIKYVFENSPTIESNILKKGPTLAWSVIGAEYVKLFTDLVTDKETNTCQIPFI